MASASSPRTFRRRFASRRIATKVIIVHGTRQWTDYHVAATITVNLAEYAGVGVRVQGLRRYYAALLVRPDVFRIVKVFDDARETLTETSFVWDFETPYPIVVEVVGGRLRASIGEVDLIATDDGLTNGGVALVISGGALSCDEIRVTATVDDASNRARQ